jgi:hypothetical protein
MTTMPLVLDANVLEIQMRYREDIFAMAHHRNNKNFRHAAYLQFVLWQHGKLGKVTVGLCRAVVSLQYVQGILLLMDFT